MIQNLLLVFSVTSQPSPTIREESGRCVPSPSVTAPKVCPQSAYTADCHTQDTPRVSVCNEITRDTYYSYFIFLNGKHLRLCIFFA